MNLILWNNFVNQELLFVKATLITNLVTTCLTKFLTIYKVFFFFKKKSILIYVTLFNQTHNFFEKRLCLPILL